MDPVQTQNNADTANTNPGVNPVPTAQSGSTSSDNTPEQSYNFSSLGNNFSTQVVDGKKIITSFLGLLLLVGGLGAGITLVREPQLFEQHAQVLEVDKSTLSACTAYLYCTDIKTSGASMCLDYQDKVKYCCKKGYKLNSFFGFCYKPLL